MKAHFLSLFAYHHQCNQKWISFLLKHPNHVSEKTQNLLNHLINAQQIWNARILNTTPLGVWQVHSWEKLAPLDEQNYQTSLHILDCFDLETTVTYTNSKGASFTNTVHDILFHTLNHATYHRAQIATEVKLHGLEPINTDYIFYKRKSS